MQLLQANDEPPYSFATLFSKTHERAVNTAESSTVTRGSPPAVPVTMELEDSTHSHWAMDPGEGQQNAD